MKFAVKVMFFSAYFSLSNFTRRFTFMESLLQNFVISGVCTENNSLPRLIKQGGYRSSHCILLCLCLECV